MPLKECTVRYDRAACYLMFTRKLGHRRSNSDRVPAPLN